MPDVFVRNFDDDFAAGHARRSTPSGRTTAYTKGGRRARRRNPDGPAYQRRGFLLAPRAHVQVGKRRAGLYPLSKLHRHDQAHRRVHGVLLARAARAQPLRGHAQRGGVHADDIPVGGGGHRHDARGARQKGDVLAYAPVAALRLNHLAQLC